MRDEEDLMKEKKDKACSVSGVAQQRTTKMTEQENTQGDAEKPLHQTKPSMRKTERASRRQARQMIYCVLF